MAYDSMEISLSMFLVRRCFLISNTEPGEALVQNIPLAFSLPVYLHKPTHVDQRLYCYFPNHVLDASLARNRRA